MSGHSKWSQIKRQKGVADVRRGQVFSKLSRELILASRQGGPDPQSNYRLRLVIQKARDYNMPMENIERAIKRGVGEKEAQAWEELTYEGYSPGGAAILLQILTDNRNRTYSEIKGAFLKGGGSLAAAGSVSWLFDPRGVITVRVPPEKIEEVSLLAIDAGAEDIKLDGSPQEIHTALEALDRARKALEAEGVDITSSELSMVAKSVLMLGEKEAWQVLRLLDRLEEMEEVQRVFTNADFPDGVLEGYKAQG